MLVDTGNLTDNAGLAGDLKSRSLIEGMNRLGYRVVNVGERDLQGGYDAYRERVAKARFRSISANLVRKDTGAPVFPPYEVVDVQVGEGRKIRVGFLGVVRHSPVFLKAGPEGSNIVTLPVLDTVNKYLPELREKADVVVLLAATQETEIRAVVRETPGIDLVLGSYGGVVSHTDRREGDTPVLYTGNMGKYVGESRMFANGSGAPKVVSYMYTLGPNYPSDGETAAWVNGVLKEAAQLAGSTAATAGAGH